MASTELNFDLDDGGQKWNPELCAGPTFCSPPIPLYNTPLDFSQVTPSELGISTQSFVPSSQGKDKSRLTQLKARRRSAIGTRGSPETNSLIRYIAQQRLKTPPSTPLMTPAHTPLQASPFFSRGFSSLKQKMASFQSLLEVGENERPAEEEEADGHSSMGEKENRGPQPGPVPAPLPYKRRRTGPFREIVMETGEAPPSDVLSPVPTPGCAEQVCFGEPRYAELSRCEMDEAVCYSPSPGPRGSVRNDVSFTPTSCTPKQSRRQSWLTEAESPCVSLSLGLAELGSGESLPLPSPFPRATCPTDEGAESAVSSARPQKKRVHFGVPLSPEFFDKRLPPSTPLQRGGTPAHLSASGGSRLRSLLKTPQKSGLPPLAQPDFNSPSLTGPASPPTTGRHDDEVPTDCADEQEEHGQVPLAAGVTDPAEDEEPSGSHEDTVCSPDVAPGRMEETSQRESGSPDLTPLPPWASPREAETGVEPMTALASCPSLAPKPPVEAARPARSRGRKRKVEQTDSAGETVAAAATRPSRRAALSASGKMKDSGGKRRFGGKAVDRSLYGKRDYASKNPSLSPITESLSCLSRSPTPLRPPAGCRETRNPSMPLAEAVPGDVTADVVTAAALWRRRFRPPACDPEFSDRPDDLEVEEATGCPAGDAADCVAEADPAAEAADCAAEATDCAAKADPAAEAADCAAKADPAAEAADCAAKADPAGDAADYAAEADSAAEAADCAAEAAPAAEASPVRSAGRGGRAARPRGRGGRGRGRRGTALSSPNDASHVITATELDLPICGPSSDDCHPGNHPESHGAGVGGEGDRHGDAHGDAPRAVRTSAVPEPDPEHALSLGREPVTAGDRGRRSDASRRSRGRRSSLYRPQPIAEEEEEEAAQSPQVHLLPAAGESEGEGERGGEGEAIADKVAQRQEEEQSPLTLLPGGGQSEDEREREREGGGGEEINTATEGEGQVKRGGGEAGRDRIPTVPPIHMVGGAEQAPPPWQETEFCIEDVLLASARGGRRSVRRSLRNQSLLDPSAGGLAWVPRSPPSHPGTTRRRTRGRRSSAHAPPTLPQDPSH